MTWKDIVKKKKRPIMYIDGDLVGDVDVFWIWDKRNQLAVGTEHSRIIYELDGSDFTPSTYALKEGSKLHKLLVVDKGIDGDPASIHPRNKDKLEQMGFFVQLNERDD